MPSPIGVIFDMDGVLVDSAAAHQQAWQQLGDEVGVPFSAARFRQTFGQRNASIIPAWLGAPVSGERLEALGARKEVIYRALVRRGAARVYPRIPALLGELRAAGARVAIASSGPRDNIALLIDTIGAHDLVDAVVAAEDVREGKPHPEVFRTAAARLALAAGRCAVIEDSVHGVEAAARAGMLAIGVLTSTTAAALRAAGAVVVLREVADVEVDQLVGALRGRAA